MKRLFFIFFLLAAFVTVKADDGVVERSRSHLELNGARLEESDILAMAGSQTAEAWKKADDLCLTGRVIRDAGWGALAVGFGMWVTAVFGLDTDLGWAAVYVASTSVVFLPLGYAIQGSGRKKLNAVAETCNGQRGATSSFSPTVIFAPSMLTNASIGMKNPTAAAPGASIVITF